MLYHKANKKKISNNQIRLKYFQERYRQLTLIHYIQEI